MAAPFHVLNTFPRGQGRGIALGLHYNALRILVSAERAIVYYHIWSLVDLWCNASSMCCVSGPARHTMRAPRYEQVVAEEVPSFFCRGGGPWNCHRIRGLPHPPSRTRYLYPCPCRPRSPVSPTHSHALICLMGLRGVDTALGVLLPPRPGKSRPRERSNLRL